MHSSQLLPIICNHYLRRCNYNFCHPWTITTTFATGGGFSLDGVHPTARGYAVVANLIMDTIESSFGATLRRVDPGTYTTTFIQ